MSAGSAILRPQPEQISLRFPRFRLTHSFKVLAFSSISCWKTVYPGQPRILVQSSRLNPPSVANVRLCQTYTCLGSVRFLLRAEKVGMFREFRLRRYPRDRTNSDAKHRVLKRAFPSRSLSE